MGDSGSWLSELDDDVITYRSLFGANLSEFASLGVRYWQASLEPVPYVLR